MTTEIINIFNEQSPMSTVAVVIVCLFFVNFRAWQRWTRRLQLWKKSMKLWVVLT